MHRMEQEDNTAFSLKMYTEMHDLNTSCLNLLIVE